MVKYLGVLSADKIVSTLILSLAIHFLVRSSQLAQAIFSSSTNKRIHRGGPGLNIAGNGKHSVNLSSCTTPWSFFVCWHGFQLGSTRRNSNSYPSCLIAFPSRSDRASLKCSLQTPVRPCPMPHLSSRQAILQRLISRAQLWAESLGGNTLGLG